MKKLLVLMPLWLSVVAPCFAQSPMDSWNLAVSKPSTQLFRLNPEQFNHHFDFPLANDGLLQIDFLRLSDWGANNQLEAITGAAAKQVDLLKDSFRNNYSTKVLEMNIPIDGKIIALNYQEDETGKRQLAYKDGNHYQLKTSFDTIRVVKNVSIRTRPLTDSGLVQVQYTFILKDISDIAALANDPEAMGKLGRLADEEIARYRQEWNTQDARSHQLLLQYDPAKEKMVRTPAGNGGMLGHIGLYLGLGGITYTNNAVSPYLEETIAFLIPSRAKMQPFVGLNLTGFGFFNTNGSKGNANYLTYNFEYGFCKRGISFMQQKTSMMLGVMRVNTPRINAPGNDRNFLFHMGFTFGVNSFLSAGMSIGTDFKKNSDKSIIGINFKINL